MSYADCIAVYAFADITSFDIADFWLAELDQVAS